MDAQKSLEVELTEFVYGLDKGVQRGAVNDHKREIKDD